MESIALVLRDRESGPEAIGVFSGDALFVGDVGRTDFYPAHGAGAIVPGTLLVPRDMIAAFAGWFLPPDRPVVLVADSAAEARAAARELIRIGFDEISGYLPGVLPWVSTGRPFDRIPTVGAGEVRERIASGREFTLLDVREVGERQDERIPDSVHIFLGELPGRLDELPPSRPITTYCGSGVRAMIAASVLKRAGVGEVENSWGSMAAWKQVEGESN